MPLFSYVEHLRVTRERYGEPAARLDMQFAIELREQKLKIAADRAAALELERDRA
jgi:hypothetical protein